MKFSQQYLILDIAVLFLAIFMDWLWIRWRKKHSLARYTKPITDLIPFIYKLALTYLLSVFTKTKKLQKNFVQSFESILVQSAAKIVNGLQLTGERLRSLILTFWKNIRQFIAANQNARAYPARIIEKFHQAKQNFANQFSIWWHSGHPIFVSKNNADPLAPGLKRWQIFTELGLIFLAVWTYCWGFLDIGRHTVLPGSEAETFQSLDLIFTSALHQSGHFLAWNPYLYSGLPLIGDPMFHFFNPLVGLPILLFGVSDGFKIAVFLSFVAGALGMWFTALAFGMKPVARLWLALLFAFAGQPTARFFQGQYLFIFSWACIPWVIGGLYAVYRTRRSVYAALTAFALGVMFLSGNAYYPFFTIVIILLFLCVFLFSFARQKPHLIFNKRAAVIYIIIGLVAIGLIAIQLLPTYQLWPRINKSEDLSGSATLSQVAMNFLSNDPSRPDMYASLPAREEFYAYIGLAPFLFLLLLPLVSFKRNKRPLLFALLMLLVSLLWIDTKDMPWAQLYLSTHVFAQFRYQLRMIIYTEIALFILMGFSLDAAWQFLWHKISTSSRVPGDRAGRIASLIGAGLLLGLAGYSILNVYLTNRPDTFTAAIYDPPYRPVSWLDQYDQSVFYVRYNPSNTAFDANITNHMRLLEPWYHFDDIRLNSPANDRRTVQATPNYVIQSPEDTPPPNSDVVKIFPDYIIYHARNALPFSFSVLNQTLVDPNKGDLRLQDVTPLTTYSPNGDFIEMVAGSSSGSVLVTLVTNFPGWVGRIDGQPAKLYSVNGYLAVIMQKGVHQYTFSYESGVLNAGIVISLLSLLIIFFLASSDLNWAKAWAGLRPMLDPGPSNWKERLGSQPLTVYFQNRIGRSNLEINLSDSHIQFKLNSKQIKWVVSVGAVLFMASLIVYGAIHFVGIKQYPLYFFADETKPSLFAQDLLNNHFVDASGNQFPLYFEVDSKQWTPLLSVYPEGISALLFGKSVATTRATSAAVSFLAVISLALMLKLVYKARYWWIGVLILGLIPAWFLFSRTAFETAMMCSFYAVFLLCYLLYLTKSPKFILPAALFAGLTFYTYANGQIIIGVSFIFLLLADFRYHLKNWRVNLWVLLLGSLMLVPLILFQIHHPTAFVDQLQNWGSYWFSDLSISQKLLTFLQKYTYGLSPQYWLVSNGQDLARFKMGSFGHIWLGMLPFFIFGLASFLRHYRTPKYRAVLLAILAVPAGSALVDIGIARVLAFVIPAALLISIGLNWLLELLSKRTLSNWIALLTFAGLAFASINLLQTALAPGSFLDQDYGSNSLQWNATQLFEKIIPKYLAQDPKNQIVMSSTWTNSSNRYIPFFISEKDQPRVSVGSLSDFAFSQGDLNPNVIFISTPQEYKANIVSNKFEKVTVLQAVPDSDGTPVFYVLQASYRSGVEDIFAREKEARKKLIEQNYDLNGQNLLLRYSIIDMGEIKDLFDNDQATLIRGFEANPFVIEIEFPQPQPLQSIDLVTNALNIHVTALLFPLDDQNPMKFEGDYQYDDSTGLPAKLDFNEGPYWTKRLRIEILNNDVPPDAHTNIHVRQLHWK